MNVTSTQRAPGFRWMATPIRPVLAPLICLLLLLLPHWLFSDNFRAPILRGDDFAFLAECHSGQEPFSNLLKPHNTHIVPAFRLVTAGVARLAPSPGDLATYLTFTNYGVYVLVMLLVGHFVAWETRSFLYSFLAMAFLGLCSGLRPAAIWYSAGQTLWASAGCLLTLVIFQRYRIKPSRIWLGLGILMIPLSTAFWGGGVTSGFAAAAYLLVTRLTSKRSLATFLLLTSVGLIVALAWLTLGSAANGSLNSPENRSAGLFGFLLAIMHTAQAIPEKLVAPSLGLDIATTPGQGILLSLGLSIVWLSTVYRRGRIRPLEAAGLVLILIPYLLAFALRSQYSYDNLRNLGWYNTIPLVGFVIFLTGWWMPSWSDGEPGLPALPSWGDVIFLEACVLIFAVLQYPRVESQEIADAPQMTASEEYQHPLPDLKRLRASVLLSQLSNRQRTGMIRLGLVGTEARKLGVSREAIRRVRNPVIVPGWPPQLTRIDGLDLLAFPPDQIDRRGPLPETLLQHLKPVPEVRPMWLSPTDPWPPRA